MNERNLYPRPELKRNDWINLNGTWDFEFDFGDICLDCPDFYTTEKKFSYYEFFDKKFSHNINVPFCPESKMSGIEYTDFINGCWYRKEININKKANERVILHFEACCYESVVFINKKFVGYHDGGYTPFSFDITDYIVDDKVIILVHASSNPRNPLQPLGKQSMSRDSHGCFYTRSTGIWQTVWIEKVPNVYLTNYKYVSNINEGVLNLTLEYNSDVEKNVSIMAMFNNKVVGKFNVHSNSFKDFIQLNLDELHLWNVGCGNLYDLVIDVSTNETTDHVLGYFGLREIKVDKYGLLINNQRVFQRLVLDQGYYPNSIYTAPSDTSLKEDIILELNCGFNGARLHQKVFERQYLYEADRLGFIVWGEYPSWNFDHTKLENADIFLKEWFEAVNRDFNHPCIVNWCPLNENFKVFGKQQSNEFVRKIYLKTKELDSTRPCIDVSSMYHVKTDFFDTHDYEQNIDKFSEAYGKFKDGEVHDIWGQVYDGKPFILSEYGGFQWPISDSGWGYGDAPETEDEFIERFCKFGEILLNNKRICGFCYTQITDVELEKNGLYYYDRSYKFSEDVIKKFRDCISKKSKYESII